MATAIAITISFIKVPNIMALTKTCGLVFFKAFFCMEKTASESIKSKILPNPNTSGSIFFEVSHDFKNEQKPQTIIKKVKSGTIILFSVALSILFF